MFNEEIQRDLKQQQSKKNTDTRNKHLTFIWSRLPRVVEVTQIYHPNYKEEGHKILKNA